MSDTDIYETVIQSLPEDADGRRAWISLVRCFSAIESVLMRHFAQEYNSSLPRYDVLTALALNPGGLTMGELATMLMVTKGNITGVVSRLKKDGLVRKATSPADRRIQSVTISAKGRRLWDDMHAEYDDIISSMLDGQSPDELRMLTAALDITRERVQGRLARAQANEST